ncbi:MAG TPA: type IV pilus twitching motility protein PilT [Kineosporiaceae bacterium]
MDGTGEQSGRRAVRVAQQQPLSQPPTQAVGQWMNPTGGDEPACPPGSVPAVAGRTGASGALGMPVPRPAVTRPPAPAPAQARLDDMLRGMLDVGASDLHLAAGAPPLVRVDGRLGALDGFDVLTPDGIQRTLYATLTQKQRERFETDLELDLAYSLPDQARFRVNLYRQREAIGAALRRIPYEIKTLEQLGMPPVVGSFAGLPRGLVLVTGPTGSGKSTTLAAVVDLANRTRNDHIMTVEDPIEFLHDHKACLVNQREVGEDTHSFANALRHALRQDPDILLVGEMRDLETISVALTAAETGHLVLATLHTQDAAQTIDRVIDVFPPHQQQQVRTQLAGALQGVVCQTLCRTASGRGRVAATEVLVATPALRNLIREGKTHQVYSALQAGAQFGMHTLDQSLADLVRRRVITVEVALEKCHHRDDLMRLIGRG